MKKVIKTVEGNARNYHAVLGERLDETDWSEIEEQILLDRIQGIPDRLPQAIHQAPESIIGEHCVANSEKILSFYDPDIHILVRGKAGAEVEFCNGLCLAEQDDGLIVDWDFMQDQPPSDSKLVKSSIERISNAYGKPGSYTGERQFDSANSRTDQEEPGIINAICPLSEPMLKEKLEDESFYLLQTRRGSTEGRIGIFKNADLGTPLRSKGYDNGKTRIEWCILSHNLWKLAKMATQKLEEIELAHSA